jgi:hypothetical protein
MYGKIFDSIYDSTVADDWRALITFQQFIVLCDADGTVDMTPQAISRRTNIPIEHIKAGIEILEAPDPYSRTKGQDGIRIERLDEHRPWGWSIVNHHQYKIMQDADDVREKNRVRKANERARKKGCHAENVTKHDSHASHAKSRHTDTDTNTDTNKETTYVDAPPAASTCPHQKIVESYHKNFPAGPRVKEITDKRKKAMRARWTAGQNDLAWWDTFFADAATSKFLCGQNDRNWLAGIDFLTRPDTATRMQEGEFHR